MTLEARARDLDHFFMVKLSEVKSLEPRQGKVPDDMKNLVFPAIFYRVNQEKKGRRRYPLRRIFKAESYCV